MVAGGLPTEDERDHYKRLFVLDPADRLVQPPGNRVAHFGAHPGFGTPDLPTSCEEHLEEPTPHSLVLVGRGNPDLVHPQLGRLIWVKERKGVRTPFLPDTFSSPYIPYLNTYTRMMPKTTVM